MLRDKDNKINTAELENSLQNISIFKDNSFLYIVKKTEKIVSAIYMITDFFSTQEPLRWSLRNSGPVLLKDIMILPTGSYKESGQSVANALSSLFELLSLFEIGYQTNHISDMNFQILKQEIINLAKEIEYLNNKHNLLQNVELQETFFGVGLAKRHETQKEPLSYKRHKGQLKTGNVLNNVSDKKTDSLSVKRAISSVSDRKEKIIEIIKNKKNVGIKDISAVILDCSEKTIQRELNNLVATGVLKKEGERRWSRYILN